MNDKYVAPESYWGKHERLKELLDKIGDPETLHKDYVLKALKGLVTASKEFLIAVDQANRPIEPSPLTEEEKKMVEEIRREDEESENDD